MKFRIILLLILLIPIQVFASNLIDVEFDCYQESNEKCICEVWGNSDETIQAVDFKVFLPSYITQSEFILEENDFGSGENNWISVIFNEPVSGHYKIGTYKLFSNKSVTKDDFIIKELTIVDENYKEIKINEDEDKDVNKKDNKNYLEIIVVVCAIIILTIIYFLYRKYHNNKIKK